MMRLPTPAPSQPATVEIEENPSRVTSFQTRLKSALNHVDNSLDDALVIWKEVLTTCSESERDQLERTFESDENFKCLEHGAIVQPSNLAKCQKIREKWGLRLWDISPFMPNKVHRRLITRLKELADACSREEGLKLISEAYMIRRMARDTAQGHMRGVSKAKTLQPWEVMMAWKAVKSKSMAHSASINEGAGPTQSNTSRDTSEDGDDDASDASNRSPSASPPPDLPSVDRNITIRKPRSATGPELSRKRATSPPEQHSTKRIRIDEDDTEDKGAIQNDRQQAGHHIGSGFVSRLSTIFEAGVESSLIVNDPKEQDKPFAGNNSGMGLGIEQPRLYVETWVEDHAVARCDFTAQSPVSVASPNSMECGRRAGSPLEDVTAISFSPEVSFISKCNADFDAVQNFGFDGHSDDGELYDMPAVDISIGPGETPTHLDLGVVQAISSSHPTTPGLFPEQVDNQNFRDTKKAMLQHAALSYVPGMAQTSLMNTTATDYNDTSPQTHKLLDGARKSMKNFDGKQWLGDVSIDTALALLPTKHVKTISGSFLDEAPNGRPLDKLRIGDHVKKIIVPICLTQPSRHWCLGVMDFDNDRLLFYNPLPTAQYTDAGQAKLVHLAKHLSQSIDRFKNCVWRFFEVACPRQTNGHDCGIFVIVIAFHVLLDLELPIDIHGEVWRRLFVHMFQHVDGTAARSAALLSDDRTELKKSVDIIVSDIADMDEDGLDQEKLYCEKRLHATQSIHAFARSILGHLHIERDTHSHNSGFDKYLEVLEHIQQDPNFLAIPEAFRLPSSQGHARTRSLIIAERQIRNNDIAFLTTLLSAWTEAVSLMSIRKSELMVRIRDVNATLHSKMDAQIEKARVELAQRTEQKKAMEAEETAVQARIAKLEARKQASMDASVTT